MLLYGNLPVQCYEMECFPFKILGFMNGFIQGKDRDKQRGGMATQRMQNEVVRTTVVFDSLTLAHINILAFVIPNIVLGSATTLTIC